MPDEQPIEDAELAPDEREMEAVLGSLRPLPMRLDRQQVLMQAMRAADRRRVWFWRCAAGAMAACAAFAVTLRRPVPIIERVVVKEPVPMQTPANALAEESGADESAPLSVVVASTPLISPSDEGSLAIRQRVLRYGLGGVTSPQFLMLAAAGKLPDSSLFPLRAIDVPDAQPREVRQPVERPISPGVDPLNFNTKKKESL